ncbi:MAG: hypothetical protein JEZ00_11250 [Anaerolineaceae bacterium]|nr:hypothetical protein [Anaerolineaceae bacterium]
MDWVLFGLILIWLGIISWFDIRKNEIPHSAWVVLPLMIACVYRTWQGGWALVLLAVVVSIISEREHLAQLLKMEGIGFVLTWTPLLFLGLFFAVQSSPIAALAILGFWLAWELKCWGGADAIAAITVVLLYPEMDFLVAFLIVHGFTAITLWIVSIIKKMEFKTHRVPGLPLIWISLVLLPLLQKVMIF